MLLTLAVIVLLTITAAVVLFPKAARAIMGSAAVMGPLAGAALGFMGGCVYHAFVDGWTAAATLTLSDFTTCATGVGAVIGFVSAMYLPEK